MDIPVIPSSSLARAHSRTALAFGRVEISCTTDESVVEWFLDIRTIMYIVETENNADEIWYATNIKDRTENHIMLEQHRKICRTI
mmetsp:Transcript_2780/g.6008  ORF Transcript_2780/g.6008 Transcript_2780/m.6008 type:complete len:85 (-) Transcript_2780:143-397(-)